MSEMNHRATFGSALAYRQPKAAIEWLTQAFGFETSLLITDNDGNLAHSELSFGNGYIMAGNEWAENIKAPASVGGANSQHLSVVLEGGIDAHCERARARGARIVMEPQDEPYGSRTYVCVDPEGHTWVFDEAREADDSAMSNAGYAVRQIAAPSEEQSVASFFPAISCRDPRAAMDWLQHALALEPELLIEGQDGLIRGHLGFGNCRIAVTSELSQQGWPPRLSPRSIGGGNTQTIHVQLTDGIDAHCQRARAAGATILQEPEDQFYGDRTYRLLDPEGHMWTFGQTLRVMTPEEWDAASGLKTQVSP